MRITLKGVIIFIDVIVAILAFSLFVKALVDYSMGTHYNLIYGNLCILAGLLIMIAMTLHICSMVFDIFLLRCYATYMCIFTAVLWLLIAICVCVHLSLWTNRNITDDGFILGVKNSDQIDDYNQALSDQARPDQSHNDQGHHDQNNNDQNNNDQNNDDQNKDNQNNDDRARNLNMGKQKNNTGTRRRGEEYTPKKVEDRSSEVNSIEIRLRCCGHSGPKDYLNEPFSKRKLSKSCCGYGQSSSKGFCNLNHAYREGCAEKFHDWVVGTLKAIGGIGFTCFVLTVISLVLVCFIGFLK